MSVKVSVEIPTPDQTARCNIEVPLDSIGVTVRGKSHKDTQKYITDFTSATVASFLQATRDHEPNSSTAASSGKVSGKEKPGSGATTPTVTANDGPDTNPKERKRSETANNLNEVFPLTTSRDYIRVRLRDLNGEEMLFGIDPCQPLYYALLVFAGHIGVPVTVMRLFFDGRRVTEISTAQDMHMDEEETLEVYREYVGS